MWVYKGQVKMLEHDHETGRLRVRILGPATGYWRLFQHGSKPG